MNINTQYFSSFKLYKKNQNKKYALQDFSMQLDYQLNQLKEKKNYPQHKNKYIEQKQGKNKNDFSLPSLPTKSIQRQQILNQNSCKIPRTINKSFKNKEKDKAYYFHNRANEIQLRLHRLEKNNLSFHKIDNFKNQSFLDENKNVNRLKNIIVSPPQYIPVPIYSFLPNNHTNFGQQFNNYPNNNQFLKKNNQPKYNMPQSRKLYLKRRLKIIFLAIYFIPLLKTYSKAIVMKKCIHFLQIQQIISSELNTIQWDIFQIFFNFDIFSQFYHIFIQIQQKSQYQKQQLTLLYQQQKIKLNIKACHQFIKLIITHVQKSIHKQDFSPLISIFSTMLNRNFPLSQFYLSQQFKLFNLHPSYGYLNVPLQLSKILMVNFIFIKIIVYLMLKKINQIVKTSLQSKKKRLSQTTINLYSKKLLLTLILFYETLNSIFLIQYKKSKQINLQNIGIQSKNQLFYQIQIIQQNDKKIIINQKNLIKGVKCSQNIKNYFINGFQDNWNMIKKIIQDLYSLAQMYNKEKVEGFKEEVKNMKFGNRKQLNSIVQFKNAKIKSSSVSKNNKSTKYNNTKMTNKK